MRALFTLLALPVIVHYGIAASQADSNIHKPIAIEITTHLGDKQVFRKDDIVSFLLSLDRDAYVLMIYEDAQHNLLQIIPNRYRPDSHYENGLFIAVPNREEPFQFIVSPPFGKETVWVFASEEVFPKLEGKVLENGLKLLTNSLTSVLSKIRASNSSGFYGEANMSISTAEQ